MIKGHFSADGSTFECCSDPLPRALPNYVWNDSFYANVGHDGSGTSLYKHSSGLITRLCKSRRRVYLHDYETGSVTEIPGIKPECVTRHSPGRTNFHCKDDDITIDWQLEVPEQHSAEVWTIAVHNNSNKDRKLSLFTLIDLDLSGYFSPFEDRWSTPAYLDENLQAIKFVNQDAQCPETGYNAFVISDRAWDAFDTVGEIFFGNENTLFPKSVEAGQCSNSLHLGGDEIVAANQFNLSMEPETSSKVRVMIGVYKETSEIVEAKRLIGSDRSFENQISRQNSNRSDRFARLQFESPDDVINRVFNIWCKHNLEFTARFTRIYSRGFRDVLQDSAGIASLDPDLCRKNILTALRHVFRNGRSLRAWDSTSGKALTHERYADGPVWIPIALESYLSETGDASILQEKLPYYDKGTGSAWEHTCKALDCLLHDRGNHGLCRIHDGDWCDTAHRLGKQGIGEGVWLSMALYYALGLATKIAETFDLPFPANDWAEGRETLKEAVNTHGWDRNWFLIAYNDAGQRIGTGKNKEGKIFLNPQSWSIISEITDEKREARIWSSLDSQLTSESGPRLLHPPFTTKDESIGSLTGFHPGTIENGSSYCHAGAFKILADCLRGRADQAFESLLQIIPGGTADQQPNADCPPFAFTNCRIAAEHPYLAYRHLNSWTTGTVSWCWIVFTKYILGVRPELTKLLIQPCLPSSWDHVVVRRALRGARYKIDIRKPAGLVAKKWTITCDGADYPQGEIPYFASGDHIITVVGE